MGEKNKIKAQRKKERLQVRLAKKASYFDLTEQDEERLAKEGIKVLTTEEKKAIRKTKIKKELHKLDHEITQGIFILLMFMFIFIFIL